MTGATRHLVAGERGTIEAPAAVRVEIVEASGACLLLRFDAGGACVADTWHASIEEAKAQARFEYAIAVDDWHDVATR